jgi:hypothetical protein
MTRARTPWRLKTQTSAACRRVEEIRETHYRRPGAQHGAPTTPEVWSAWKELWGETVAGDHWASVTLDDARDILRLGWQLAVTDRDYGKATEILRAYFGHPQIEHENPLLRDSLRCEFAMSALYAGEEDTGLALYRSLLQDGRRAVLAMALDSLWAFCSDQPATKQPSAGLTAMVCDLSRRLRRRWGTRGRAKRLPDEPTNQDLTALLLSVMPR